MRVGFYQFNPVFGKTRDNLARVDSVLSNCSADLMVLPEFFATGYLFLDPAEVQNAAEGIPDGPTCRKLLEISGRREMHIVAGIPEISPNGKLYNSAIAVTPDGRVYLYRKIHLFDREKLFFSPGDLGFQIFDTGIARIGMMICFDWFFPESARCLSLDGADIIAHPSNLVLPYCPQAMITRCLENHVYSITCNRIGTETRGDLSLNYIGNSRIIDPLGNILASADREIEVLRTVDIDIGKARQKSLNDRNHILNDRRPEVYQGLYGPEAH